MNYSYLPPLPLPVLTGIRFGNCQFSEPEALSRSSPLDALVGSPGVYVILAYDDSQRPRRYRALYFGESENMHGRATSAHENYPCWQREAGSSIYRAFHSMPGSTRAQRQAVESALIADYQPTCNRRFSLDLEGLFGRSRLR